MRLEQDLIRLREAGGLSPVQLASRMGVTRRPVQAAEFGGAVGLTVRPLLRQVPAIGGRLEVRKAARARWGKRRP